MRQLTSHQSQNPKVSPSPPYLDLRFHGKESKEAFQNKEGQGKKTFWLHENQLERRMYLSLNMQGLEIQLIYVTSSRINLKQQVLPKPPAVHLYNL